MFYLFVLFTAVPLIELWLLIHVGGRIGAAYTILLVLCTGLVGASLARWQGTQALRRVQKEMRQGMIPAGAMMDGVLIFAAGLLLITPGILTDLFGLSLLIPPVRKFLMKGLRLWFTTNVRVETQTFYTERATDPPPQKSKIIDAKVVDVKTE